jgi:hypothetical protein
MAIKINGIKNENRETVQLERVNSNIWKHEKVVELSVSFFIYFEIISLNSDLNHTLGLRLAMSLCLLFNQNMVIYIIFFCKEMIWEISRSVVGNHLVT